MIFLFIFLIIIFIFSLGGEIVNGILDGEIEKSKSSISVKNHLPDSDL